MTHIAQPSIGRRLYPVEDPRMAEFRGNPDRGSMLVSEGGASRASGAGKTGADLARPLPLSPGQGTEGA